VTFQRMEITADPIDAVQLASLEDPNCVLIPNPAIFLEDTVRWESSFIAEQAQGHDAEAGMAATFVKKLADHAGAANTLIRSAAYTFPQVRQPMARWHNRALIEFAVSKTLQELAAGGLTELLTNTSNLAVVIDGAELEKSGVFFKADVLADLFEIETPMPGAPVWYKGEWVYLKAIYPAIPPLTAQNMFKAETGFTVNEAVFLQPRPKAAAWLLGRTLLPQGPSMPLE
jgi:hypothetical protein